jgi:hypothetical protein
MFKRRYGPILTFVTIVMILSIFAYPAPAQAGKPTPPPPTPTPGSGPAAIRAGLRSSDYGISPWPSPEWWVDSINSMKGKFSTNNPTGSSILVVVEIDGMSGPGCWAHFPAPATGSYPGVRFDAVDEFEPMLVAFDDAGIKAWVQVESSACDMIMLIDLVMGRYGHHQSVIGFGVDDEWYLNKSYQVGKPITDGEAAAWVTRVRSYIPPNGQPAYQVFLKHWLESQMPPTYRTGLVFINDSQGFRSLSAMVTDFAAWGAHFAPSPVGFQYGYPRDKRWWSRLGDPPGDVGKAIMAQTPNTADLYWVDFSAYDIWPAQ